MCMIIHINRNININVICFITISIIIIIIIISSSSSSSTHFAGAARGSLVQRQRAEVATHGLGRRFVRVIWLETDYVDSVGGFQMNIVSQMISHIASGSGTGISELAKLHQPTSKHLVCSVP